MLTLSKLQKFPVAIMMLQDAGVVKEFDQEWKPVISAEVAAEAVQRGFDEKLIREYRSSNGVKMTWWKDPAEGTGGSMELVNMESMFEPQQWLVELCDQYPTMDKDLRHFRLLDVPPRVELSVGFFDLPGNKSSGHLYVLMTGDQHASDLDLDFEGYIDMAIASRVYFYWQKVLVDIRKGKESPELKTFRQEMTALSADFSWEEYVNKYNSLRLSLRK